MRVAGGRRPPGWPRVVTFVPEGRMGEMRFMRPSGTRQACAARFRGPRPPANCMGPFGPSTKTTVSLVGKGPRLATNTLRRR
jgi:hypothetical protein